MQLPLLKKKFFILLLAVLLIFSLNIFSSEVRGFFSFVFSPLQAMLWRAGDRISDFAAGILNAGALRDENEILKADRFSLISKIAELQDTEKENEELRRALQLGVDKDFDVVFADIIGKSIGDDVVLVRAGKKKGVREGMPVMTLGKVAFGKVVEVWAGVSRVRLLSDKASSLDAQIPEKQITGVVRGQGAGALMLDLVPSDKDLAAADMVVTSNLGGVFPENLLIGEVKEILKTGADPFQKAAIQPFFDLPSVESVLIIIS